MVRTALLCVAAFCLPMIAKADDNAVKLGEFSVSLTVKDLPASRAFYEKLGFAALKTDDVAGLPNYGVKWVILRSGSATIGLFQGFPKNTLTFHPPDVRAVQRTAKERGLKFMNEADETKKGLGWAMIIDPDGNPILLDQVVP